MKITKIDEQLSLRERMLKKVNEGIEDEVASEPVEAPEETDDEVPAEDPAEDPAEAPAEEPTDEITISLTPDEVDILQKIVGIIDGSTEAPVEDVPAEDCPGCDDPDCPDCGAGEDVDPADEPFEIPDLSGMTPDEDDSAYFG